MVTVVLAAAWPLVAGCSALARGKDDKNQKNATEEKKTKGAKAGPAEELPEPIWNDAILEAIGSMPIGGGYSKGIDARDALMAAVAWEEEKPALRPAKAQPSFCSGGTYLVFLVTLAREQRAGRLKLSPEAWRAMIVEGQADGAGVWGRWNANGPGTARLFQETGAGRNFVDIKEARSGDFMKIFWNDSIGASERGHSVIFLGLENVKGEDMISYWSSNQPGGYSSKQVSRSKVKRMLFSRLEAPERLEEVVRLPERDAFLAGLEEKSATPAETARAVGIKGW